VDAGYFGGHVRTANCKANRVDRRLVQHRTGKRRVVVIMRERGGTPSYLIPPRAGKCSDRRQRPSIVGLAAGNRRKGSRSADSVRLARMGRLIRKPPGDFPKYQEALAANVKRLREKAGLSQQELAAMTKLRQALVSDIERCQAHVNPTLETLTRLADALEVDVLVLLRSRKT
jgi:DNA-binding XRE family transcriptional regulator